MMKKFAIVCLFFGFTSSAFAFDLEMSPRIYMGEAERFDKVTTESQARRNRRVYIRDYMWLKVEVRWQRIVNRESRDMGIPYAARTSLDADLEKFSRWTIGIPENVRQIRQRYLERIIETSRRNGVDPVLTQAIVAVESSGVEDECSSVMACGLMQVKQVAAAHTGYPRADLLHPWWNLFIGTKYLALLDQEYNFRTLEEILLAYRYGPNAAMRKIKSGYNPLQNYYVRKVKHVVGVVQRTEMGS